MDATTLRGVVTKSAVLVTITAPGAEVLPFDAQRCRKRHPHRCSGRIGCRVEQRAAHTWTETVAERAAALLNAAGIDGDVVLDMQARGVPHVHVIVPDELPADDTDRVTILAPAFGFGYVESVRLPLAAARTYVERAA